MAGAAEQSQLLLHNLVLRHFMIGGGVFLVLVYWLFALLFQPQDRSADLLFFISLTAILTLLGFVAAFWLLRRGLAEQGSRTLFMAMVLCAGLGVVIVGGASGTFVIVFALPVVSAGLMGRGLDVGLSASASVAVYTGLLIAEGFGYTPIATTPWINLAIVACSLAFLAGLGWMSGRDLRRSLLQSDERASEMLRQTEQMMERGIQQVELGSELGVAAAQVQNASQLQAGGGDRSGQCRCPGFNDDRRIGQYRTPDRAVSRAGGGSRSADPGEPQ
jgi:hypothetical protein